MMKLKGNQMFDKYFSKIVVGLLVVLLIQGFFETPSGISQEEEAYRLKIHDLSQEKLIQLNKINVLTNENQIYENFYDSLEADHSLDTVKSNQLRINLSNYANSRR